MKLRLIAIVASILALAMPARADDEALPVAAFDKDVCDLGYIKEANGPVECQFKVTNTGEAPLVIISVKPSCGCTAANYTTAPITAGQEGVINVEFDPTGFIGGFRKTLVVKTNAKKKYTNLYIEGSVIPKK